MHSIKGSAWQADLHRVASSQTAQKMIQERFLLKIRYVISLEVAGSDVVFLSSISLDKR